MVSLAVAFGMIGGSLDIPFLTDAGLGIITVIAGWIVVIGIIISVIMAIID